MDELTINMQKTIIKISEDRLNRKLSLEILSKIKKPRGYIGLEWIIDMVSTIDEADLEGYLNAL